MAVSFGQKLRTLRTIRGLYQTDLEHMTGIPRIMIIALEKGDILPGLEQLQSIEAALGLRFDAPEVEAAFLLLAGEPVELEVA